MNEINVHNNWDPLEEIWLGDCWPASFYDNLEKNVKDDFYQLTECTKEDLAAIQKKFEDFGVIVRRPVIDEDNKQLYTLTEKSSILRKPPICPRDHHGVVGDKLFIGGDLPQCYSPIYNSYDQSQVFHSNGINPAINGANMVKLGRDIIFDHVSLFFDTNVGTNKQRKERIFKRVKLFEEQEGKMFGNDYRLHFSTEGGHLDSCYMPIKEKLVLTTKHFENYDAILPEWRQIGITSPSYIAELDGAKNYSNKVFQPGLWEQPALGADRTLRKWLGNFAGMMDNAPDHFNAFVNEYCADWIGNYKETYFEVNVVPIDDKNLICIDTSGVFDNLFIELENQGITCHKVPWRTRGFWDGGIHCITLDVRRRGELTDYFPNRGEYGISTVRSKFFNKDTEKFFKEYSEWKSQL
tara:strand:- start:103 stop:1329 length:1227 start_codon:yes stop_codon:yes gene_type:complete